MYTIEPRLVVATDFEEIGSWYRGHNEPPLTIEAAPPTGLIVPGQAAAWLYLTDGDMALLENYITNPEAPLRERYASLEIITVCLESIAKQKGYKRLAACIKEKGLVRAAERRNFNTYGTFTAMGKDIS